MNNDVKIEVKAEVQTLKVDVTWKEVMHEIDRMTRLATAQDPDVRRFALSMIERLYACYLYPQPPPTQDLFTRERYR